MNMREDWLPPGRNCGACGAENCAAFLRLAKAARKGFDDCPFYQGKGSGPGKGTDTEAKYTGSDILGHPYEFVLAPLGGEVSARKIILPFRPELVEILAIGRGDRLLGRPMGAGCPIPHVLEVIKIDPLTGVLDTWVVGPREAREGRVKDIAAYFMLGFEGTAAEIRREPAFGCRATFLPGFCMMNLNHTGLVNMVLAKKEGLHVRLEDIRIMAGRD